MTQLDRIEAKLDQLLEAKKPKPRKRAADNPEFDVFWEAYPIKKGKQAALRAYKTAVGITHYLNLVADVKNRVEYDSQWQDKQYIPRASTYLNGELWNDEITCVQVTLPKSNDLRVLEAFAVERGLHERGCAPQNIQNPYQYREWITERL